MLTLGDPLRTRFARPDGRPKIAQTAMTFVPSEISPDSRLIRAGRRTPDAGRRAPAPDSVA